MSTVRLQRVSKRFDRVAAVHALDLEIVQGEFLTLLGPSGCGKTTTLRMIAGFVEPTEGRVFIGGEDVTDLAPQRRTIGMVFQDYALFPHLTVAENIAFGLVERGVARAKIAARVKELLDLIRLPDIAARFPPELSGGQQQRVALARAIAYPPRVLLMDEPLGALDLKLREAMQVELRRIQQELRMTTVYVTHDQTEAMTMSDRIAVMNGGRIEQLDTPPNIYGAPRTAFVANFLGKVNLLAGTVVACDGQRVTVDTRAGKVSCAARSPLASGARVSVALRPENVQLLASPQAAGDLNRMRGRIESATYTGNLLHLAVRVAEGICVVAEIKPGSTRCKPGDEIPIGWHAADGVLICEE